MSLELILTLPFNQNHCIPLNFYLLNQIPLLVSDGVYFIQAAYSPFFYNLHPYNNKQTQFYSFPSFSWQKVPLISINEWQLQYVNVSKQHTYAAVLIIKKYFQVEQTLKKVRATCILSETSIRQQMQQKWLQDARQYQRKKTLLPVVSLGYHMRNMTTVQQPNQIISTGGCVLHHSDDKLHYLPAMLDQKVYHSYQPLFCEEQETYIAYEEETKQTIDHESEPQKQEESSESNSQEQIDYLREAYQKMKDK